MQKWEYQTTVSVSGLNQQRLNEYGANGWELVCVVGSSITFIYYFKRRVN